MQALSKELISKVLGEPLYLLGIATPDHCERIIWGEPTQDSRWQNPEYLNPEVPWGNAFDPHSIVGSIGFSDVTTQCPAPRDERLEELLLCMRIGIAHDLRGRGYGKALHKIREQYAKDLGMIGIAIFNPHQKYGDVFDDYQELLDTGRRRWMIKKFQN